MKVCCVFSLELPHGGDSNEYTQYTSFNIKKEITLNYPKSAAMGCFLGTQKRVRNIMVNEPSVFEPLKFYCISKAYGLIICCNGSIAVWQIPQDENFSFVCIAAKSFLFKLKKTWKDLVPGNMHLVDSLHARENWKKCLAAEALNCSINSYVELL